MSKVEAMLKQYYTDFVQFKENNEKLLAKRNAALEHRYVVQTAAASMTAQRSAPSRKSAPNLRVKSARYHGS